MKRIYSMVFFWIVIVSCSRTEIVMQHCDNGKLMEKYEVKNGLKNGCYKLYDCETGQLTGMGTYINDTLNGTYYGYYNNGTLKYELNYLNGVIEGETFEYWENGIVKSKAINVNGHLNGPYSYYDSLGNLRVKGNMGKLKLNKVYLDENVDRLLYGKYTGDSVAYYETGRWFWFDERGSVIDSVTFKGYYNIHVMRDTSANGYTSYDVIEPLFE